MNPPATTLVLSAADVRACLDWDGTLEAIAGAFRAAARDEIVAAVAEQIPLDDGSLHVKAGGLRAPELLSVKANVRPSARRAYGTMVLFDPQRAAPLAILDAGYLTGFRTAAVAVLAARSLGATGGEPVALIGAGPVAQHLRRAIAHTLPESPVHVWSRDAERAAALAGLDGMDATVHGDPGAAAQRARIVFTVTPSRAPLLGAAELAPDALVIAMGSDEAGKRELATDVLDGAALVADDPGAARRVGECAYRAEADVIGLAEVLAGAWTADRARRTVFDSVGTAFVDTAVGRLVQQHARDRGLGTEIAFAG